MFTVNHPRLRTILTAGLVGGVIACGQRPQPPAPASPTSTLDTMLRDGLAATPPRKVPHMVVGEPVRLPLHLFPESVSHAEWSGAVALAESDDARLLRSCGTGSTRVAIAFRDESLDGGTVSLSFGGPGDSMDAGGQWAVRPHLAVMTEAAVVRLFDEFELAAPDTVTAWVADTTSRSYPMAVRQMPTLACVLRMP